MPVFHSRKLSFDFREELSRHRGPRLLCLNSLVIRQCQSLSEVLKDFLQCAHSDVWPRVLANLQLFEFLAQREELLLLLVCHSATRRASSHGVTGVLLVCSWACRRSRHGRPQGVHTPVLRGMPAGACLVTHDKKIVFAAHTAFCGIRRTRANLRKKTKQSTRVSMKVQFQ